MDNQHIDEKVHHGHNIKRLREALKWKQEYLAQQMNLKQSSISVYENQKTIENKTLHKFSEALKIPVEVITNLKEDPAKVVIENIFKDNKQVDIENSGWVDSQTNNKTYESIGKVSELYERIIALEKEIAELKSKNM